MRLNGARMSGASRYHARNSGVKRSSTYSRSASRMSSRYKSLFEETKNQLKDTEKTSEEQSDKSATASKSTRTKAKDYSTSGSKFNSGVTEINDSIKEFDAILEDIIPDMDKAYAAAEKFADGYNQLYSSVSSSSLSAISKKTGYLDEVTGMFSRRLDNIGITLDKNGKLSVDKEKFAQADQKDLGAIFGQKSSYASIISEQADNISKISSASQLSGTNAYSFGGNSSGSAFGGSFFNSNF